MKKLRPIDGAILVAMACVALSAAVPALGQESNLSKPLADFTLADLFPSVVDEAAKGTARSWQESSDVLVLAAHERAQRVASAIKLKKGELDQLKTQAKSAKKDKDFTTAGTLEGQLKTEQIVVRVLEQLEKVSKQQLAVAESWRTVATEISTFVDANVVLDDFRDARIVRPEAGEKDQRIGASGQKAFTAHTDAMVTLGEAFSKFGSQMLRMGSQRKSLLNALEKGGHVGTPPK